MYYIQHNFSISTATIRTEHKQYFSNEDGTDGLSRNVGKKISLYAANNPTSAQISFTPLRKPEITRRQIYIHEEILRRQTLHSTC